MAFGAREAASLSFIVEPQVLSAIVVFPAAGAGLGTRDYSRIPHAHPPVRTRFDLVLAERSRIARELHDTLLQGLSGITMQLQALWTKLPASKEKQVPRGDHQRCRQMFTPKRGNRFGV